MVPLYSTEQVRQFDSFAIESLHVPSIVLMENAAVNISRFILNKFKELKSIGVVCGKGNNGGDGFAVARHLYNAGLNIKCIYLYNENQMSSDCLTNFSILKNLSKHRKSLKLIKLDKIDDLNRIKNCDLIIDAILGSGFSGELNQELQLIVKRLNSFKSIKISLDIPTGINSNTGYGDVAFKSDYTITLGEYKKGLFVSNAYELCGEVILEEIGIGLDYFKSIKTNTFLIENYDVYNFLPKRSKTLNKYSAGKVLVIAGSYDFPGASYLTSSAAFNSGAGATILAVPDIVRKFIYKNLPEIVIQVYGYKNSKNITIDDYKNLEEKIIWADVVAIGPGLGRNDSTIEFVNFLLKQNKYKFCVLDADALFAIKDKLNKIDLRKCILTPHLGEFSYLINVPINELKKDLLSFGQEFVKKFKTNLILKGAPTITFDKNGDSFINTTGNNGLAKFGSGDVLTGIIAGFLSQLKNQIQSAILSVYIHGLASDLIVDEKTEYSLMSSDLIKKIPYAIKFLRRSIEK